MAKQHSTERRLFFLISPFIVPPVLLQTISTLRSLLMTCRKCIQWESFYQQIGLEVKEETTKVVHLEYSFVWCWNLDSSGSRLGIPENFEMCCWIKTGTTYKPRVTILLQYILCDVRQSSQIATFYLVFKNLYNTLDDDRYRSKHVALQRN